MATWIVHLRVAEIFAKKYDFIDEYNFFAGNLAPDCGYGQKDSFGEFQPPPMVTHWTDTGSKRDCKYKEFYEKYLKNKEKDNAYSFYLGYYIHLMTDVMWAVTFCIPTYTKYADEYSKNPEFLRVIKLDWNDQDFRYLNEKPDFVPYNLLDERMGRINDYLPYYEENQLTKQIRFIIDNYKTPVSGRDIYREYVYLNRESIDNFVLTASEMIDMDIVKKNLV